MDVLISGAGIAGPGLAWWLVRQGHRVTIVEQADALRTGGYIIDFWGQGYALAGRMGLLPAILEAGYQVEEVRLVDGQGKRRGGFDVSVFDRATDGRFTSLPRGELSRVLFEAVADDVETTFGDSIATLEQRGDAVEVSFERGAARTFDLVVGCEGIHSRTRELAFGPEEKFERFLGYGFAAFLLDDYPHHSSDIYMTHGEPGRQAARFSLRDGSTLVLLIWRDEGRVAFPHDPDAQRALLRELFGGCGWEVPGMLARLDDAHDLYLDRVSQIRMDRWHHGRIALLGDAAFAPSFLAGQGSALALIGGYVLAGELGRAPGHPEMALAAYERRLAPFMLGKQDAAVGMAKSFVPATQFGIRLRRLASHLLAIPPVADLFMGRSIRDEIDLPDYS